MAVTAAEEAGMSARSPDSGVRGPRLGPDMGLAQWPYSRHATITSFIHQTLQRHINRGFWIYSMPMTS